MGLLKILLKRGLAIFSTVGITLILLCIVAGATGLEERILRGKMNYLERGYGTTLHDMFEAGEIEEEDIPILLEEHMNETYVRYGLDKTWWERLIPTLFMIMTLDLGEASSYPPTMVGSSITNAIPYTIMIITASMGVSAPLGILIGASTTRKSDSRGMIIANLLSTISFFPGWILGYLLIPVLLKIWFPNVTSLSGFIVQGGGLWIYDVDPVFRFFYEWILPIVSLAIPALGFWTYQSRNILLNIAKEDFVTLAEAKGLQEGMISRRYILRVGLPSILTQVGLVLHATIANSVVIEAIFRWHGLGHLLWRVVYSGGPNTYGTAGLLLGIVYTYALVYAFLRFALEILYIYLDPRIRY